MKLPRLRFTVRRLMVAVALVALASGGYLWVVLPPYVRVEIAPQPLSANTDHDIFDIVLLDLIENKEFVSGLHETESKIVLDHAARSGFRPGGGHEDRWMVENKVPAEVLDDVAARNPRRVRHILANYHPSSPNILVRDMSQIPEDYDFLAQFPNARGYVETDLPGYSRDGLSCLMHFSFGPTAHGADGYYFLKKIKGRWEIVGRSIRYYT